LADRDLAIQDFTVVVVPGMRLNCLPRARRERAAVRARRWARTERRPRGPEIILGSRSIIFVHEGCLPSAAAGGARGAYSRFARKRRSRANVVRLLNSRADEP